jgi:hypothetical protein
MDDICIHHPSLKRISRRILSIDKSRDRREGMKKNGNEKRKNEKSLEWHLTILYKPSEFVE